MVVAKLKTLKELKELNIFDFQFHGDMIEIKRKNESASLCLDSSYFGEVVLVTSHTAIHANALTICPELVDRTLGDGFVAKKSYDILKQKFSLIKTITESNQSFKIKELEQKLKAQPDCSKLQAKVAMLEAQLELSKKIANKWRADAASGNSSLNVANARASDNKKIHDVGQETYQKALCKS
jgi:hypothetical protein